MGLKVLVVHGDVSEAGRRTTELAQKGYEVVRVADLTSAAEVLMREPIDSIVCSDEVRSALEQAYGALIPVVPMGSEPTAALIKTLARLARRSLSPTVQLSLAAHLDDALAQAMLALDPLVDLRDGAVRGHRATLLVPRQTQDEILEVAAQLGRSREVRRTVRRLACESLDRNADRLLVDCGIDDLMDTQLYDESSMWARHAKSILLAVAERDVLVLAESDARERLEALRSLGFSLAVRVGTDVAGLTSVGVVVPSFALLDVAAFGAAGPVLTRVVASVVAACREISVGVIADVATPEQAACARATGCILAVGRGAIPGRWRRLREPAIESRRACSEA